MVGFGHQRSCFSAISRSILESIGRIYSTCNLQESNRRVSLLTRLLLYWPGPVYPAGRVQPRGVFSIEIGKVPSHSCPYLRLCATFVFRIPSHPLPYHNVVCVLRENVLFGLLWWASATNGVAFRLYLVPS